MELEGGKATTTSFETDMGSDHGSSNSIECFQNYSASEVFVQGLAGFVDQSDVEIMIATQKRMLQRFEKTNEMLSNCNSLSFARLKTANQQLKSYKQLLTDIKKDLDYSFKRIHLLKDKLKREFSDSLSSAIKEEDSSSNMPDDEKMKTSDPNMLSD